MPLTKKERFIKKFQEHLQFIQRSCKGFDEGFEDESIRIATSLRVIFHNTPASTSLINHLNFFNKKMLSSGQGGGSALEFLSWVIKVDSPQPVSTRPILGNQFREISINDWWNKEPIITYETQIYSRRRIILNAVNKDGGAHVEEELDRFYEALSSGVGMDGISITGNLEFNGEPWFEQGVPHHSKNAHLALIRQFAHEVLAAVNHFDWLKTKTSRK